MKVTLGALAWVTQADAYNRLGFANLRNQLVVQPKAMSKHNPEPTPIQLYEEREDAIGFPRAFFLQRFRHMQGLDIDDRTVVGEPLQALAPIALRPDQIGFVDEAERLLRGGEHGVILNARTGAGKSIMALELARRLGMRTLILVYKENLMTQWLNRIKYGDENSPPFFPDANVGVVRSKRCEFEGRDFVVGMIQSLISREYSPELYKAFGLIVIDEVHRTGAEKWSQVVPKFPARHYVGLSATPDRKDKAENAFLYHIGEILVARHGEEAMRPTVYLVPTGYTVIKTPMADPDEIEREEFNRRTVRNYIRNFKILEQLVRAARAGRNVIAMTERVKHAQELQRLFIDYCARNNLTFTSGLYVGSRLVQVDGKFKNQKLSEVELEIAARAQVMFATFKMAEDALDIPRLDTIILCSPISDPRQAVGRILREFSGKKEPFVVDMTDDDFQLCRQLLRARMKKYYAKGWKVVDLRKPRG